MWDSCLGMERSLLVGMVHNAFLVWIGKTLIWSWPLKTTQECICLRWKRKRGMRQEFPPKWRESLYWFSSKVCFRVADLWFILLLNRSHFQFFYDSIKLRRTIKQPIVCLGFNVSANYTVSYTCRTVTWLTIHHITLVLPMPLPLYPHQSEGRRATRMTWTSKKQQGFHLTTPSSWSPKSPPRLPWLSLLATPAWWE